eukprot:358937-Chlamydomonas_euryale.AAC.8
MSLRSEHVRKWGRQRDGRREGGRSGSERSGGVLSVLLSHPLGPTYTCPPPRRHLRHCRSRPRAPSRATTDRAGADCDGARGARMRERWQGRRRRRSGCALCCCCAAAAAATAAVAAAAAAGCHATTPARAWPACECTTRSKAPTAPLPLAASCSSARLWLMRTYPARRSTKSAARRQRPRRATSLPWPAAGFSGRRLRGGRWPAAKARAWSAVAAAARLRRGAARLPALLRRQRPQQPLLSGGPPVLPRLGSLACTRRLPETHAQLTEGACSYIKAATAEAHNIYSCHQTCQLRPSIPVPARSWASTMASVEWTSADGGRHVHAAAPQPRPGAPLFIALLPCALRSAPWSCCQECSMQSEAMPSATADIG